MGKQGLVWPNPLLAVLRKNITQVDLNLWPLGLHPHGHGFQCGCKLIWVIAQRQPFKVLRLNFPNFKFHFLTKKSKRIFKNMVNQVLQKLFLHFSFGIAVLPIFLEMDLIFNIFNNCLFNNVERQWNFTPKSVCNPKNYQEVLWWFVNQTLNCIQ